jgi:hypothetical protein
LSAYLGFFTGITVAALAVKAIPELFPTTFAKHNDEIDRDKESNFMGSPQAIM